MSKEGDRIIRWQRDQKKKRRDAKVEPMVKVSPTKLDRLLTHKREGIR